LLNAATNNLHLDALHQVTNKPKARKPKVNQTEFWLSRNLYLTLCRVFWHWLWWKAVQLNIKILQGSAETDLRRGVRILFSSFCNSSRNVRVEVGDICKSYFKKNKKYHILWITV